MSIAKSIGCSIDVTKIDKSYIVTDDKGRKWLRLRLVNTPDSQYQSDYMVVQDLPKEDREAGKQGAILGNGKAWGPGEGAMAKREGEAVSQTKPVGEDDLPF